MDRRAPIATRGTDLLEHLAVKAWSKLRPERIELVAISRLQSTSKASVYRLEGVGPRGSDVIAKRSSLERILRERTIYEQVLPALPVPTVHYYGSVQEPEGDCAWLFLEDAGGERYSPRVEEHRALAARWLGLLHTSAAWLVAADRLPDRGPGYYLERLRSARDAILRNLTNPALSAGDVAVLEAVVGQCEVVAAHWGQVERVCERTPRTLIHGDFAPKNMRVRTGPEGIALVPFDWGSAGWGVTAADMVQAGSLLDDYWANPDLAVYLSVVRESWPYFDVRDLQPVSTFGKIFRCLVCVDLEAESLATEWVERCMRHMRLYTGEMAEAIHAAGWEP